MVYKLKIFTADEVSAAERAQAEQRFRTALEICLGDQNLVLPVYQAYLRLLQHYGAQPRPWPLSVEEQLLLEQWEAAELAATQCAFGAQRYMGDAVFEITP